MSKRYDVHVEIYYMCKVGDSADLSIKIKSLIIDKKLRKALELEAMRSYARKYSYQTFLDKYQTLYNRRRME